ncbi:MAG TPA: DUF3450 domain-containing protein [Gammaproteobacteria bacterium]|nr:DUF3450 domain-containing protein [Gammaproteobacteria bacterium]
MHIRLIILVLLCGFSTLASSAESLDKITKEGQRRIQEGKSAQNKVSKLSDRTADIVSDYKTVTKVVDGLVVYNDLLDVQISNQLSEAASIQQSIENVSTIERHVVPLMTRMIDSLEKFVELDVPFLAEERTERVEKLRKMMVRSDVSGAEKFRRVIEAYQIENDYGRTIEAYRGSLTFDDRTREVDFLRVGRVALLYQTIGRDTTGAWDSDSRQWVELSAADYKQHVAQGIRIARKQVAPDLIVLPVAAAKEAK